MCQTRITVLNVYTACHILFIKEEKQSEKKRGEERRFEAMRGEARRGNMTGVEAGDYGQ